MIKKTMQLKIGGKYAWDDLDSVIFSGKIKREPWNEPMYVFFNAEDGEDKDCDIYLTKDQVFEYISIAEETEIQVVYPPLEELQKNSMVSNCCQAKYILAESGDGTNFYLCTNCCNRCHPFNPEVIDSLAVDSNTFGTRLVPILPGIKSNCCRDECTSYESEDEKNLYFCTQCNEPCNAFNDQIIDSVTQTNEKILGEKNGS